MKEDKIPKTLQGQAFERAKNPTTLNAGTPHDWEDLYQNTKAWQESSDGWVKTMTDWLREKVTGTTTSSTKTSK